MEKATRTAAAMKTARAAGPSAILRPPVNAELLLQSERALGPLPDGAFGKLGALDVAAVADLGAAVGSREDRPVARLATVVDAVRHPHVEVLVGADEARVGDPLAGVARVVDCAFQRDRQVERVELVQLVLLGAADLDRRLVGGVGLGLLLVAGGERERAEGNGEAGSHGSSLLRAVTYLDAGGCSLGSGDRLVGALAAGEGNAHPAVVERLGLGENPEIDRTARGAAGERFGNA